MGLKLKYEWTSSEEKLELACFSNCQELTTMSSSWLASKDDIQCSVEIPSGLLGQLKNLCTQTATLLALMDSDMPVYYVHRILRELAVRICCPSISSDANYRYRTSCQLPPAYIDTKTGQILISVDYMAEVWGTPKEKCVRFFELWCSEMDIDTDGKTQTDGNICQHFQYAQNEYFYVHGRTEFDVGTLSVKDISLKIVILVCCLSYNVSVCMSLQLIKHERILYLVKISVGDKEKTCLFQELIGLSWPCCCLVI
ncbi:LOW QUALITY PROTEIN: ankyrin and armadillo repeat-containing protein [Spheniscus humboldti]